LRSSTPTASPTKLAANGSTPRLATNHTVAPPNSAGTTGSWTPRGKADADDSPKPSRQRTGSRMATTSSVSPSHGNSLSKLQPSQVRTLREGFQILDRDGDGVVNRDDVADMLTQLGTPLHDGLMVEFSRFKTNTIACRPPVKRIRRFSGFPAFSASNHGNARLYKYAG
jgi:hypothetical protein